MYPQVMFELAPCGLALMSADYKVLTANRYFLRLAERTQADLAVGLKFTALLSGAGRIFAMTRLQQELALRGSVEELVLDLVTPGGARIPVMLNAVQETDADGHPGQIRLAVWRAAGARAYEQEVPKARQQAADAAQVKADFLANISHEIRTPLNGVVGAAAMLAQADLARRERELVAMIQSSSELAVRLLADVLDVAQVQAGALSLKPEPFGLTAALEGALEMGRLQAQAKRLAFEVQSTVPREACFLGDGVRVRQALAAVLSNAVKFTDAGRVRVEIAREPDGAISIAVRDTGVGFPAEEIERLFHPFEQSETGLSRSSGGAGVGLAICRGLVELMGGSVAVAAEAGGGSGVTLRIPLEEITPSAAKTEAGETPQHALRVLVVEDNPTNRRVVEMILEASGVELAIAENGALGVEAWQAGGFDLILMDLQMPVMDGLTATREIRRLEAEGRVGRRTPIVVLSANAMAHHQKEALEAGADLHLAKPVTPQALIGGIEAALAMAA